MVGLHASSREFRMYLTVTGKEDVTLHNTFVYNPNFFVSKEYKKDDLHFFCAFIKNVSELGAGSQKELLSSSSSSTISSSFENSNNNNTALNDTTKTTTVSTTIVDSSGGYILVA